MKIQHYGTFNLLLSLNRVETIHIRSGMKSYIRITFWFTAMPSSSKNICETLPVGANFTSVGRPTCVEGCYLLPKYFGLEFSL